MYRFARVLTAFAIIWTALPGQGKSSGIDPVIRSIEIRGNKTLNKESIITTAGLKVGDAATPAILEAAQRSLLASGFYGMRRINNPEEAVKVSVTDVNPTTNEGKLLIQVEENDVVQGFNITGNGPIAPKEVLAQIQTKPGFVLNINTLRTDIDRITRYYDTKGYIATIDDQGFGLTNGILDVPIVVGKVGPSGVVIRGLTGSKLALARRDLRKVFTPGQYYNARALREALPRLEKAGIDTGFENLSCTMGITPGETVNHIITLREKR